MYRTRVKIICPFFGGGSDKCYGWAKDGFKIWGIGINKRILEQNSHIEVEYLNMVGLLDCEEALRFADIYNSYETKGIVELAVISTDLCRDKPIDQKTMNIAKSFGGVIVK